MDAAATYLTCRLRGCDNQADIVVVTIREGFCFERCTDCAADQINWPPLTAHPFTDCTKD